MNFGPLQSVTGEVLQSSFTQYSVTAEVAGSSPVGSDLFIFISGLHLSMKGAQNPIPWLAAREDFCSPATQFVVVSCGTLQP